MRKHWLDNLRWTCVLLVLLYHVFYFFNNKGVLGGMGGFNEGPQYQDIILYILYPWFMALMFLLAGISSRYALDKQPANVWFKARSRKLLVPATIGLFVFQWVVGYFNTRLNAGDALAAVPQPIKYFIWAIVGTGPLWFIQNLWLFSALLLLIRKLDSKDKCWQASNKIGLIPILLMVILIWLGNQSMIDQPRLASADGLYNLHRPLFYIIPFLLGYFVFSHDRIQEMLGKYWKIWMTAAAISGIILIITTFGENFSSPQYLSSPLCCAYTWLMCLAMMAFFKQCFDKCNAFSAYMSRASFGIYIVHYSIIAVFGYMMKMYTTWPPVCIYSALTIAVFALSPLLYEIIRRIPFIRWCILGEKR